MLELQHSQCAICGDTIDISTAKVDHDHTTDRVRELLCGPCNTMLGMAKDSELILRKGIRYLGKHRRSSSDELLESYIDG